MAVRIAVEDPGLLQELKQMAVGVEAEFISFQEVASANIIIARDETARTLLSLLQSENRPTLFVTIKDGTPELPFTFVQGYADDILVLPVRRQEFLSRIRWHFHLQHLRELENTSAGLPALVKKLEEDLALAEKIQRRLIRDKFPSMQGLAVKSKYLCGMRSGGDYFDVIEFPGGQYVGFLLTDASSYSLSANLLGVLMHQSLQIEPGAVPSPEAMVAKVLAGVEMKEKDKLSVFFGILNRKTFRLSYVSAGPLFLCKQGKGGTEWLIRGEHEALSTTRRMVAPAKEVQLEAEERFLLCSDGWSEGLGQGFDQLLEAELGKGSDAQSFVNDFSFKLQQSLEKATGDDDPMPPQDCSLLVVDIDKGILRLA